MRTAELINIGVDIGVSLSPLAKFCYFCGQNTSTIKKTIKKSQGIILNWNQDISQLTESFNVKNSGHLFDYELECFYRLK